MGERDAPCCAHIAMHLCRFAETKWCDGFGHGNLVQWIFIWRVRILMSNEQKMAIFSLLYDEQMCNWLRVVLLPDIFILFVWSNMVGEEYTGWSISASLYVSVPLGYDDGFSTLIYNNNVCKSHKLRASSRHGKLNHQKCPNPKRFMSELGGNFPWFHSP